MYPKYKKIKKIYEGAEAEVWLINIDNKELVLKKRKPKRYREKILDDKIISQRLRKEIKMYEKLKAANILGPMAEYFNFDEKEIIMPYFKYPSFKKTIQKDAKKILLLGKEVAKLHNAGIVHGDITLENVLFDEKQNKPVFIDFGLSFVSTRPDDFATDIFVFKETLCAEFPEILWKDFLKSYEKNISKKEIVKQLDKIEKRRRNSS